MNSAEYYSRGINYQNFGYDQYFGLKDLGGYSDELYQLDRELILNETFYNEMFKGSGKFVNYIITYSNHLPFTTDKGVCRKLIKKDYEDKLSRMSSSEQNEFINNRPLFEKKAAFFTKKYALSNTIPKEYRNGWDFTYK